MVGAAMKTRSLLLSTALLTACGAAPRSLYNGVDLAGWHTDIPAADDKADLAASFVVEDGVLISRGTPQGHLITDAVHQDYRLEVEWRWPGKPGNCGVLVHASTPRRLAMSGTAMSSPMHQKSPALVWCSWHSIDCGNIL